MNNLNKKSSRDVFEFISSHCYTYMVPYKYNDLENRGSLKYAKGRVTAYEWINELSYYYIKKEENLKKEFIFYLESKNKEINILKKGDYKKGLKDALNEVLQELK